MSDDALYRTVVTVEVLSRGEPFTGGISELHCSTYEGDNSGILLDSTFTEVTPARMAGLLIAQGSAPEFLGLNPDGSWVQE